MVAPRFYQGKFRLSILPSAGLGYIAESLKRSGFSAEVLDMNLGYSYNGLRNKIFNFKPDIIGFSVMTFGHRELYGLINKIKHSYPKIKIAAGGPHVSILKERVLKDCEGIDFGIILEGDSSFIGLCKGEDLDKIRGLIYRKNSSIIVNAFEEFILDLDHLSFPKYESFELDKYPTRQIGIVTSRGCPYDCIFCPVISAIGKQFRQRSAQSVVDEIGYWYDRGYRVILILDDNFTLSRKRTEEICDLLSRKDYKYLSLKCPNGIRADRVDYSLLKLMRETGFDMIAFGVEAAVNRVLKNINKGEDIETIERSIRDACNLGFDVDLFFIIGSPGETRADVEASFSLAMRYPVRSAKFYNIIPFPDTKLYKWLAENKYFLRPEEEILNNASHFVNTPCFYTPEMSARDRKEVFRIGQNITKKIRRKFIERKLKGPRIVKSIFSRIYTVPFVEDILINNPVVVRIKEYLKHMALSGSS